MNAKRELKLRLFQYDPDVDELPRYAVHTVPFKEHMRVLDALNHVYEELDTGLGYRWYCGTKKCGECALTVNGKPMLACWEAAREDMTCEPLTNFPIIRDLVVDTAPYERMIMGLAPAVSRKVQPAFPEKLGYPAMQAAHRLTKCIECNVCTAAVPVKGIGRDGVDWAGYSGPAALVRFSRFVLDPRDESNRRGLAEQAGLKMFPLYSSLENICPQGIDIVGDALRPARRKLFGTDEALLDDADSSVVFIIASGWSAFVRLTGERKAKLIEAGDLRAKEAPGMTEVYEIGAR